MEGLFVVDVTPENVMLETLFCVKDITNPGFERKKEWFTHRFREGLRLKILKDANGKSLAFIEYLPGRYAWRPVSAENYTFIHCMFVYSNKDKKKGMGSMLVDVCEKEAQDRGMAGVSVMTSDGPWITDKRLFLNNGFVQVDKKGRFELMVKKFDPLAPDPKMHDWTKQQAQYTGWNLVYADQCPWHEKSVLALQKAAREYGVELKIKKILSAQEAQQAPSGFGVFSLLYNGKLLEDHYLSETRFRNILAKTLKV